MQYIDTNQGNHESKVQIAVDERTAEQFSSNKVWSSYSMKISICLVLVAVINGEDTVSAIPSGDED